MAAVVVTVVKAITAMLRQLLFVIMFRLARHALLEEVEEGVGRWVMILIVTAAGAAAAAAAAVLRSRVTAVKALE